MKKKANISFIKLVNLLSDGAYHDGTNLGETLGLTRSAVWKAIKKLQNYGVAIDSVKGKGYSLLEPLVLLDINKIKKRLNNQKIEIVLFEEIDSTNTFLKSHVNKKLKICLAEKQTQGRGRFERKWISPFGKNIYLSCFYPFQKDISELAGLSLVTSLAVFKTLKEMGVDQFLAVKWPNDILYHQQKIAGSLIEIQAETHGSSHAIIGIGLNVNMNQDHGEISQDWQSIQKIIGKYIDRNELCAYLIQNLLSHLKLFDAEGLTPFVQEWIAADCLSSQTITLKNANQHIHGKVKGINQQGHLLLKLPNGKINAFSAGDTSIAKE